jgi:hypothetical protein
MKENNIFFDIPKLQKNQVSQLLVHATSSFMKVCNAGMYINSFNMPIYIKKYRVYNIDICGSNYLTYSKIQLYMVLLYEHKLANLMILILGQKEVKSHKEFLFLCDINPIYSSINLKFWNIYLDVSCPRM